MRFRQYDNLRSFAVVARHMNMGAAADELNLSKGAVSYQVRQLEDELGFAVFSRAGRGLTLNREGQELMRLCAGLFDSVERGINGLRQSNQQRITIGMSTYFASRWLSPRLMHFITGHPEIGLLIQPLVDLTDLRRDELDLAVRWGKGDWHEPDYEIERIFRCPAVLTTSVETGRRIDSEGIAAVVHDATLLHDRATSAAWADWFAAAGIEWNRGADNLVIPDPNVRAQAVIDGQGIALNDSLVDNEVVAGRLYQYQPVQLENYGYYLVYPRDLDRDSTIRTFRDWIMREARLE